MTSVEVRSSGWGPRARRFLTGSVLEKWLTSSVAAICELWPRDGVAIIIRRES